MRADRVETTEEAISISEGRLCVSFIVGTLINGSLMIILKIRLKFKL